MASLRAFNVSVRGDKHSFYWRGSKLSVSKHLMGRTTSASTPLAASYSFCFSRPCIVSDILCSNVNLRVWTLLGETTPLEIGETVPKGKREKVARARTGSTT